MALIRTRTLFSSAAFASAVLLTACATPDPSPPARLEFAGTIDTSGSGIGFVLTHPSGLSCSGKFPESRLPNKFAVPLTCSDGATNGSMEASKGAEGIYGTVVLADGRSGVVSLMLPSTNRGRPAKR